MAVVAIVDSGLNLKHRDIVKKLGLIQVKFLAMVVMMMPMELSTMSTDWIR